MTKLISEYDAYHQYDEMLNECYPTVIVCGYEFDPARALKELDPIAYRCGFNDWLDAEGLELK